MTAALLKVGSTPVDVKTFLATARFLGVFDLVVEHVVQRSVVIDRARRSGLVVTNEELQEECDRFRQSLGLSKAADTTTWLARLGYTLEDFEAEMELRVVARKKRASFSRAELEAYENSHRGELDRVRISHIVVKDEKLAADIHRQVKSEKVDFAKLARAHSLDEATRDAGGYLGWVGRSALVSETATRAFAAAPGECLAPSKLRGGRFGIVLVHEARRPTVDDSADEVRERLLAKWLSDLRVETRVEVSM